MSSYSKGKTRTTRQSRLDFGARVSKIDVPEKSPVQLFGFDAQNHKDVKGLVDGAQSMPPALTAVLDTYWADYSVCLSVDGSSKLNPHGSRKRNRDQEEDYENDNGTQTSAEDPEHDGMRFLELVAKLSSTANSIPAEIYERIITLVENDHAHKSGLQLSHEGYLVLQHMHTKFCPTQLVKEASACSGASNFNFIANACAWTPLSLASPDLDSDIDDTPTKKVRRRNVCTPWIKYCIRIQNMKAIIERRSFGNYSGHFLVFKYITSIISRDLSDRICIARQYMTRNTESSHQMASNVLHDSVLYRLMSLAHSTVDGANNNLSVKSVVEIIAVGITQAIDVLKKEKCDEGKAEEYHAVHVISELFQLFSELLNMICSIYSLLEEIGYECLRWGKEMIQQQNDRKALDTWLADIFMNRQLLPTSSDRNALLHSLKEPRYKLRFMGELFARYLGKQRNIPEHLVSLRRAVLLKDAMCQTYVVDESEILEFITEHTRRAIVAMELIDNVALLVIHIINAQLALDHKSREILLLDFNKVVQALQASSSKPSKTSKASLGNVYIFSSFVLALLVVCHSSIQM